MPQHKTVEETATTAEENPVEEAATVAKTVKNSESGNILDIFNPNKKGTATGDDQQQPANIFDLFKPKTDDAGNDQKKVDTDSKDADTKPFGLDEFLDKITLVKPRKITSDNSVKTHDDTKIEGNENDDLTIIDDLADALKREKGSKKTNGNSSKNTDDKKTDVKPLFPSDDPFNLKKTIEDAQQAMKEKGLGGLIQSVQQNVQATCTALFVDGGAQQIIESVIVWFKDLMKIIEEKGIPAVMSQVVEKIKEILAKSIIENNKWPAKALTQI
ncbi:uncharacterized protein LOC130895510 isoform X2 [Diorhabda carinulata]|uniref:uncharacterized protein LOC130895510 isoform X2 n=1 Tax=Diorhabda carinulata TaxID=1163345 RepID=UPI0025A148C7|nr:uncharacterized protein LOC130895510 isoform X2 [Diorhabda carinulata]